MTMVDLRYLVIEQGGHFLAGFAYPHHASRFMGGPDVFNGATITEDDRVLWTRGVDPTYTPETHDEFFKLFRSRQEGVQA